MNNKPSSSHLFAIELIFWLIKWFSHLIKSYFLQFPALNKVILPTKVPNDMTGRTCDFRYSAMWFPLLDSIIIKLILLHIF